MIGERVYTVFMNNTIALIEHRRPMRDALRLYLGRFPNEWQIVDEIDRADPDVVLQRLMALKPSVLILNRTTAGPVLESLLQAIRCHLPQLQVVVIAVSYREAAALAESEADGVVLNGDPPSTLLTRLRGLRYDRDAQ